MTASSGQSSALVGLLRKETYHILRDRRTLIVITLIPILQVIIFGYAIRTDVQHVRLAIVDPAPDYVTLALRGRFSATDTFRIVAVVHTPTEVDRLFQRGDAGGPRLRVWVCRSARTGASSARPDHLRRNRTKHGKLGAGIRAPGDSGVRARASCDDRRRSHRAAGSHSFQSDA
jgi:hypothetical protein